jgi:hypothetical protein
VTTCPDSAIQFHALFALLARNNVSCQHQFLAFPTHDLQLLFQIKPFFPILLLIPAGIVSAGEFTLNSSSGKGMVIDVGDTGQ